MSKKISIFLACWLISGALWAQPNADFSASVQQGCAPLIVVFTDLSSGSPTSWSWNFGNGNTSTLQNPAAIFANPGNYTITLTATNGSGSDTETKVAHIQVYPNPQADFTVGSPSAGCLPHSVTFTDISTAGFGAINSWNWDFGDGGSSTVQNPTHVYNGPGTYNVTLTVGDILGCTGTTTKSGVVTVHPLPSAGFATPTPVACLPANVSFTTVGSSPLGTSGGTQPYTFFWSFGDGNFGSGASPSHTYGTASTFDVKIVVTDANGCQDSITKLNYISTSVLTGNFNANNTNPCTGNPVQFIDLSAGGPTFFKWYFGDGDSSSSPVPAHTYTTPGTYTVTQIVGKGPCLDTVVKQNFITVQQGPVVNFNLSPKSGCTAPLNVTYTDQTTGATSISWNFGNGQTSTSATGTTTYNSFGTYTVTLNATGANGCNGSKTAQVKVGATTANFTNTPNPVSGCIPVAVQFTDLSISADSITNWAWNFGDGNTSNLQSPNHTYTSAGQYTVSLIITTVNNCKDTITKTSLVSVGSPATPLGTVDTLLQCVNGSVSFTNQSTGNIDSLWWDFGDGGGSSTANPSYAYNDTGCHVVTLTVYSGGCPNTFQLPNPVCIDTPLAVFVVGAGQQQGCTIPHTVNFTNNSVGAQTWSWNFGDGNTSNQFSPNHTYNAAGSYTVTLTVSDPGKGCSDQMTMQINVSTPPTVDFTFGQTSCAPVMQLPFTSSTTGNIASYNWSFPGGMTYNTSNTTHSFTTAGSHPVTLTVVETGGCSASVTKTVPIYGPVPNIAGLPISGCIPFVVPFQNITTSAAPVTTWFWKFGDGTTSSMQNPTHGYGGPGWYPLTLIAADSAGCIDSLKTTIKVGAATANFTVQDTMVCPGVPIYFNNISTSVGVKSYVWDFGDSSATQTVAYPTHTFADTGSYTVTLAVSEHFGCKDTLQKNIHVVVPKANFISAPDTGYCPPLKVTFTDQSTPANYIATWFWDFGDGGTSVLQNPTHTYTTGGVYTVTLIVTAPTGCSDTLTLTQQVVVLGPAATVTANPDSGCVPLTVQFVAQHQNVKKLVWDMGDGNTYQDLDTVVHTYLNLGVYQPILIIDDSAGCLSAIVLDTVLVVNKPVADFTAVPTTVCQDGIVQFTDQSTSQVPLSDWYWDFGDGSPVINQQNPTHQYSTPGQYTVTLIAENIAGCSDTVTKTNYITVRPTPTPNYGVTDTVACNPWSVQFTDSSSGASAIVGWVWDFGDGSPVSNLQHPVHNFQNPGNYTVMLIVTDADGCFDTIQNPYNVPALPNLSFTSAGNPGCMGDVVTFTAATNGFTNWTWNFGDGNTGTDSIVSNTYNSNGYFDVTLIGTNIYGCLDTFVQPNHVFIDLITANASVDNDSGCVTVPFNFTDLSTSDTTIVSWAWDFDDNGATSSQQNPSHQFSAIGTYNVTLIVTSAVGCQDTFQLPAIVVYDIPAPPVVPIHFATVIDDNTIYIKWATYSGSDFDHYTVYRESPTGSNNWIEVDSLYNPNDTVYNDIAVNTISSSYCYRIVTVNQCLRRSDLNTSPTHCTVELNATSAVGAVDLLWNHYTGWNAVDHYDIYRISNYDTNNVSFLASVPGNVRQFVDSVPGCHTNNLRYRVRAVELQGGFATSWSDTSGARPIYIPDDDPVSLCHVTVEDDQFIRLNWSTPTMEFVMQQFLERSDDGNNWTPIATLGITDTTFLDQNVDVHSQSYYYRLISMDSCNNLTSASNLGRSILLNAAKPNNAVELTWNFYEQWSGGLSGHRIEILDEASGTWLDVDLISGDMNLHKHFPDLPYQDVCYRVVALEEGGQGCESMSNEACVPVEPVILVPNAFSPNGDGLNDEFLVTAFYLVDFRMAIYNRWGELVFESMDISKGWNGTFNGQPSPEAAYVFVVEGTGVDGSKVEKKGSVTLIR